MLFRSSRGERLVEKNAQQIHAIGANFSMIIFGIKNMGVNLGRILPFNLERGARTQ